MIKSIFGAYLVAIVPVSASASGEELSGVLDFSYKTSGPDLGSMDFQIKGKDGRKYKVQSYADKIQKIKRNETTIESRNRVREMQINLLNKSGDLFMEDMNGKNVYFVLNKMGTVDMNSIEFEKLSHENYNRLGHKINVDDSINNNVMKLSYLKSTESQVINSTVDNNLKNKLEKAWTLLEYKYTESRASNLSIEDYDNLYNKRSLSSQNRKNFEIPKGKFQINAANIFSDFIGLADLNQMDAHSSEGVKKLAEMVIEYELGSRLPYLKKKNNNVMVQLIHEMQTYLNTYYFSFARQGRRHIFMEALQDFKRNNNL